MAFSSMYLMNRSVSNPSSVQKLVTMAGTTNRLGISQLPIFLGENRVSSITNQPPEIWPVRPFSFGTILAHATVTRSTKNRARSFCQKSKPFFPTASGKLWWDPPFPRGLSPTGYNCYKVFSRKGTWSSISRMSRSPSTPRPSSVASMVPACSKRRRFKCSKAGWAYPWLK